MKSLLKFSTAGQDYLTRYSSVRLIFINGEEMKLGRKEAVKRKGMIQGYVDDDIIIGAYKVFASGREIKMNF